MISRVSQFPCLQCRRTATRIVLLPELLTRRTTDSDPMSGPDTGHEHVSLTNREPADSCRDGQPPNHLDGTNPAKGPLGRSPLAHAGKRPVRTPSVVRSQREPARFEIPVRRPTGQIGSLHSRG
jgi:hypothetical protein